MHAVGRLLEAVSWDFRDAPVDRGVHGIHPYPAKFIPEVPRHLIDLFHPGDGSPVLDPFCGSGTTLVEAIAAGVDAWGVDLHPLACLISRVKTQPLPGGIGRCLESVMAEARCRTQLGDFVIPAIPHLGHWFKPEVQRALAALVATIRKSEAAPARELLEVALSSIIVRVSNQESDTRYAAVTKKVTANDVFLAFERAAHHAIAAVGSFREDLFRRFGSAQVLNRDLLEVVAHELPTRFGLVITSPPYPNAYEYWLYHKYRMWWLGMDPLAVRRREIGARPHYFCKQPQDETDFERQMRQCFALLAQVMQPRAKACFLVGRSIIHGREINNVALLQRAAGAHGFVVEGLVERTIPQTRKAFNPAHAKIDREHIIVFSLS